MKRSTSHSRIIVHLCAALLFLSPLSCGKESGSTGEGNGDLFGADYPLPGGVAGMTPYSPRNGGFLDAALASSPRLALFNSLAATDAGATYTMELYQDHPATGAPPIARTDNLKASSFGRYVIWEVGLSLEEERTYLWRARGRTGGSDGAWSGPYSFTVSNPCRIAGAPYAEFSYDLVRKRSCETLEHNDPTDALGAPDAQSNPYRNFVSLDSNGEIILEMGMTVVDQPGDDLRVFEYVSWEPLELMVAMSPTGPWRSIGALWCPAWCDFDLATAGIPYARFLRIRDLFGPKTLCHETIGADIDAVEALQPVSANASLCQGGW